MPEDWLNLLQQLTDRLRALIDNEIPEASAMSRLRRSASRSVFGRYVQAELASIGGTSHLVEQFENALPPSVRLRQFLGDSYDPADVSYLRTDVSFYADRLVELLNGLGDAVDEAGYSLCMAILTNVLPVHWWNWPMKYGLWYEHPHVARYRDAMASAVAGTTRIERLILLHHQNSFNSESKAAGRQSESMFYRLPSSELWQEQLAYASSGWTIYFQNGAVSSCSPYREHEYNSTFTEVVDPVKPFLEEPDAVIHGLLREEPIEFYALTQSELNLDQTEWRSDRVDRLYVQALHGSSGGMSAYLPISYKTFLDHRIGFGGFHDVMFIGVIEKAKAQEASDQETSERLIWNADAGFSPNWLIGFLASMKPEHQSLVLCTVRDGTLDRMWMKMLEAVMRNGKLVYPVQDRSVVNE